MEEQNDCAQRHCIEVVSACKAERNFNPKFLFDNTTVKGDFYDSDGEGSFSAHTDGSVSSASTPTPAPISEVAVKLCPVNDEISSVVGTEVYDLKDNFTIPQFVNHRIENDFENSAFLVTNLAAIEAQLKQWQSELPMVEPFYAVKCNPDAAIVRLLASLGCGFDCATEGEIDLVVNGLGKKLSFGSRDLAATKIVYANPAKHKSMIQFAINNNVRMTVFDGEDELYKIAALPGHENLQLLLRLTTDDRASVCRFSKKFGCPVEEAPALLKIAQELGLNVIGVSFHVGSGCGDASAYVTALLDARKVFEEGDRLGMAPMHLIDIGGGFPGDTGGYGGPGMPTFQDLARAVREGLELFQKDFHRPLSGFRVIAEPGRYFVSASTTTMTKVYSRKGGKNKYQALYVDDGVYGSFNSVLYDHATPVPLKLSQLLTTTGSNEEESIPTTVFGPTCDGLDVMCTLETTKIPRCEVDDWLLWENQGAYTHTASYVFNGYTHIPKRTFCYF